MMGAQAIPQPPPVTPAQRFPVSRMPLTDKPDFREGSMLKEYDKQGRVVGRFRCGKLLGRGGFAKCYEVEQDAMSYALKVIERSILQRTKTLQKLHSEISIHRRMKHKNIVNFIRTFQDDWNVYILLEKCSNQTLMELSKRRPRFSVPETQYIMLQSLSAIQYMHDQCIIHRDLKLGNMMMDADMNVKVGDFGLAAELQYDGERKRTICGTPNYIAPEIIEGSREGHSYEVDIWSLGVILYTLLVGEPPFQTSDVKATYRRIKQCRYEFPPRVVVPESGKDLIHCILQSRPDHRPTLIEIRTHPFFRNPTPPVTAPLSLFSTSRRRIEGEGQDQQQLQQQQQQHPNQQQKQHQEQQPYQRQQPLQRKELEGAFGTPLCAEVVPISQGRREVLRPISTNTMPTSRYAPQSTTPSPAPLGSGAPHNNVLSRHASNNVLFGGAPRQDAVRPSQYETPEVDTASSNPRASQYQLDEEEKNHLTAVHDHLHQTLLEAVEHQGREKPYVHASTPAAGPTTMTEEEDEKASCKFPLPPVWVTDYADFSAKYGLCYRLNTGHTGVHYNDSTKMVWEPITGRVEYYARIKETVTRNGTNVVHARDQRQAFHMETFPESLNKKVTLIKYFKSYLTRARSVREGVDVVRCSPYISQAPVLLSEPHMIEDIVYVKRWLLTPQAMIFRLSNKTIQVCFHDKAEVILSSESRIVTYTDANGRRVTMALSAVTSRSSEIAARLRYTKDILCELIQNREL
ncbi:protein kinase [Trypanosoma grayi]|uniref:protein kinase n=1 Tax=Trypanosoma grayi TaxID=71804 RepID=UPI0004F3F9BC|nr:protein kinase [Trypanosoma grayi]KEG13852.1 protein kinase [Trypanosoma grayi]